MAAFLYEFEWDPVKAQTNFNKHGSDFQRAAAVFMDPLALTIPDEEHSETEARWIALGKDRAGPRLRGTAMKPEYDFSKGECGKFFRPNGELRLPIYLEADVQAYLTERAAEKGIPLGEMVNALLKQEIQIIESVK
jgi:hypothetical protein